MPGQSNRQSRIKIKDASGHEVDVNELIRNKGASGASTPGTGPGSSAPSPVSVEKQQTRRPPIRMETEEAKQKRLKEEEERKRKEKAEEERKKKEKEEEERKAKEEVERKKKEEEERIKKAEEDKRRREEDERRKKEEEERKAKEEGGTILHLENCGHIHKLAEWCPSILMAKEDHWWRHMLAKVEVDGLAGRSRVG